MFRVIEHVADRLRVMRWVADWLAPHRVFAIETLNIDSWEARLFRQRWWGGYHPAPFDAAPRGQPATPRPRCQPGSLVGRLSSRSCIHLMKYNGVRPAHGPRRGSIRFGLCQSDRLQGLRYPEAHAAHVPQACC